MTASTDQVKNWMHMFRWIVKLIRDDFGVEETLLKRDAVLETDIGLEDHQIELVLEHVAESFGVRFPDGTVDEVVRLEELCMLASWLGGLYKRPGFLSQDFADRCLADNPGAG